ncbi:uncharacterized protein LOC133725222 isoform X2 [Rosa rugosa]|uniref:uncharacterized protein LOC133725222 isoform X2 n=1 Tax=Rosa rugosa TaxID=74645 RepID=UPI002B400E00|nr:uncharacterized protein LOC133725222 isoform X2 [Rosa rugosa]
MLKDEVAGLFIFLVQGSAGVEKKDWLFVFLGGAVCKKVRGETRCLELSKRKRDGVQLDIDIPKHTMRAVGTNCQFYITGMGCFVRKNVPLQIKKWSELSREDVALLIRHAREKFKLSNESHVDEAIEKHMMRYFTTWRYNLRKKFLKMWKRKIGTI